jgi:hypothetical protein
VAIAPGSELLNNTTTTGTATYIESQAVQRLAATQCSSETWQVLNRVTPTGIVTVTVTVTVTVAVTVAATATVTVAYAGSFTVTAAPQHGRVWKVYL